MEKRLSRRNFLKKASVAAALSLSGCVVDIDKGDRVIDEDYCKTAPELIVDGRDPFTNFVPRQGTDSWYINWNVKYDQTSPYATDFDDALAFLGLRDSFSYDVEGTEADRLTRILVQKRTLEHLSRIFLNHDDGNPSPDGLPISFVKPCGIENIDELTNTICIRYVNSSDKLGAAFEDGNLGFFPFEWEKENATVSHNCGNIGVDVFGIPVSKEPVGVFVNLIANAFNGEYYRTWQLREIQPVGRWDENSLKSLIFRGLKTTPYDFSTYSSFGFNQAPRDYLLDVHTSELGKALAFTIAHEIGHSSGLSHAQDLKKPFANVMGNHNTELGRIPVFNEENLAKLRRNLPGKYH